MPEDSSTSATASGSYPGDDAPQAEIAAWMGSEAQKRGLPAELPVMAGLVESGLRNLDHGDADSVGFFQMRVGIWNKGDYAGLSRPGRSCSSSGSSIRPRRSSSSASRPAGRSTTPAATATGSPTSSARPPSTAAATSSASSEARGLLRQGADSGGGRRRRRRPARAGRGRRRRGRLGPARGGCRRDGQEVSRHAVPAGAGRPRRPASTARDSCSGRTPRPASRSRAPSEQQILASNGKAGGPRAPLARRPGLLPRLERRRAPRRDVARR